MKKLFISISAFILVSSVFAATPSFDIHMESDAGDYIGQWNFWSFSNTNESILYLGDLGGWTSYNYGKKERGFGFSVKNFDWWFGFSFDAKDSATSETGLFYPAKRFPFNDEFNGIDVSWNGRGCNEILGWFYIHEISFNSEWVIQKLAVDFVQACEKSDTVALYGSIRINSSIASKCTNNNCSAVKKLFPDNKAAQKSLNNISNTESPVEEDSEMTDLEQKQAKEFYDLFTSTKTKYPFFYKTCLKNGLESDTPQEKYEFLGKNTYINVNVCGTKYLSTLKKVNAAITKKFWPFKSGSDDDIGQLSAEDVAQINAIRKDLQKNIKTLKTQLAKKNSLATQIYSSSLMFFYQIMDISFKYIILGNQ